MIHREDRFTGVGGRSIYWQSWAPEAGPRALLLVSHGLGEHSGRYQSLASYFVGHNFAVAALDHNGHGYSEGIPGFVASFADYVSDLGQFHEAVVPRFPGVPVFLVGHSMGGLVGGTYLLRSQDRFQGVILSGLAIRTADHPGPVLQSLIRLLAVLVPRLGLTALDPAGVCRDPEVVRKYTEDPQVFHGKLTARLLREFFAGMARLENEAGDLALPMLVLHGGDDNMVSPESSEILYTRARSEDKTLKIYPGLYHEIFNEPEKDDVLAEVLDWCENRLRLRIIASPPDGGPE
jgi:alpha-beta hydrolase superfamily lysophospholipase